MDHSLFYLYPLFLTVLKLTEVCAADKSNPSIVVNVYAESFSLDKSFVAVSVLVALIGSKYFLAQ